MIGSNTRNFSPNKDTPGRGRNGWKLPRVVGVHVPSKPGVSPSRNLTAPRTREGSEKRVTFKNNELIERQTTRPTIKKMSIEVNDGVVQFAEIKTARGYICKIYENETGNQPFYSSRNKPEERKQPSRSPYRRQETLPSKSPKITSANRLNRTISAKRLTFIENDKDDIVASYGKISVIRKEVNACFQNAGNKLHENILMLFVQMLYKMQETSNQKLKMHVFPVNALGLHASKAKIITIDPSTKNYMKSKSILSPDIFQRLIFINKDSNDNVSVVVTQNDQKQYFIISVNQSGINIKKTIAKANSYLADELVLRETICVKDHALDFLTNTFKQPNEIINCSWSSLAATLTIRVCYLLLKLASIKQIDLLSNSDAELDGLKYFRDTLWMMFCTQEVRKKFDFNQEYSGKILQKYKKFCSEGKIVYL